MSAVQVEPATWCRVLRTGPPCPHPCVDCNRANALLTDEERTRILTPVDAPPDPASLDATRPDDLDTCPICGGDGAVQVQTGDPYSGAWDGEECWACAGTGTRGAA